MRRLVLIFMMLLLPLQWSWAAAASVCEHEAAGAHFGHHEHKHAGASDASSVTPEVQAGSDMPGSHPDCHTCHGMGAAFTAQPSAHAPGWAEGSSLPAYGSYFPEPPLDGLLRPPMSARRLNG